MKTKRSILWGLCFLCLPLYGQSAKATMLQQIAALRVYGQYVQKGYEVVNKGLTVIGDIKDGEFNLHRDYFGSLSSVNPLIANHDMVINCIQLQLNIVRLSSKLPTITDTHFNGNEIAYFQRVKQRVLNSCEENAERLYGVVTDNSLTMEDTERIRLLTRIYTDMQSDNAFIKKFTDAVYLIKRERQRGVRDTEGIKKLYNIN